MVKVWNLFEMQCIIGSMNQPGPLHQCFTRSAVFFFIGTRMMQAARRLKTKPFCSRKYLWHFLIHSHVAFYLNFLSYPPPSFDFISPDTQMTTPALLPPITLNICQHNWCLLPLYRTRTLSTPCCQHPKAVHLVFLPIFTLAQLGHCAEPCSTRKGRCHLCSNTFLPMNNLLL